MDDETLLTVAQWVQHVLQHQELEEIQQQTASLKALYAAVLPGGKPVPRIVTPATFKDEYTKGYRKVLMPLLTVKLDSPLAKLDAESKAIFDADRQAELRQVYALSEEAWAELTTVREVVLRLATLHKTWADALWGSLLVPDNWRSAYHYEAAGYLQKKLGDYHHAGQYYHFAGNKFRSVEAWERAAETYLISSKIAAHGKDRRSMPLALRSAKRAMFCYRQVEETKDVKAAKALLKGLKKGDLPEIPED